MLAELLSAFPWPAFLLEPSQQCNISSHEYIICANLTVLLLTVLFVLHSPAVVQNQIQHLWACSVVVQQLKGLLPVSLEGTLSSVARHLTSWLPPLKAHWLMWQLLSLIASLVLGQVFRSVDAFPEAPFFLS